MQGEFQTLTHKWQRSEKAYEKNVGEAKRKLQILINDKLQVDEVLWNKDDYLKYVRKREQSRL